MILSVQIVKDRFMQEIIWFKFQAFGLSATEYTKYAQKMIANFAIFHYIFDRTFE